MDMISQIVPFFITLVFSEIERGFSHAVETFRSYVSNFDTCCGLERAKCPGEWLSIVDTHDLMLQDVFDRNQIANIQDFLN
jgi:hypothetical protein